VIVVETRLVLEKDNVQEEVKLWDKAEVPVPDGVPVSVHEGDPLKEALSVSVQPVAELAVHVADADNDDVGVPLRLRVAL